MDLSTRIATLVAPAVAETGLELDGVSVTPAGKRSRVLVTVDLPETEIGSADMDTVAQAARAIGAVLDEANVPSTPYTLEVSTPGIDRPLTLRRHFMRARSRKVSLHLDSGATVEGRLTDVDGDVLLLATDDRQERIALADVRQGSVLVEFKRLD